MEVLLNFIQSVAMIIWIGLMFYLLGRQRKLESKVERAQIKPPEDPQPICGCGHHGCFHDDDGCGFITRNLSRMWSGSMMSEGSEREEVSRRGCKRYTGPEPLPTVIS